MTTLAHSSFIAALLALGLPATSAHGQIARTFVSSVNGDDANDCNRSTPCRSFQAAHDKTLANGEITVLDPGGYGAVTITKTISIINDGVGEAGVLVSGGATGITVAAGAADSVSLRGLTVKGIGFGGGNGIVFNSGASLTIENCVVRNLTGGDPIGLGIALRPNGPARFAVLNTLVAENGRQGILLQPSGAGAVKAVFRRIETYNNGAAGLLVFGSTSTGTLTATVSDSVAAHNGGVGLVVNSSSAPASLMVVRSVATKNSFGIFAGGTSGRLRVGHSTITGNANSWGVQSILESYGDNYIDGNGDGDPAIPAIIPKK